MINFKQVIKIKEKILFMLSLCVLLTIYSVPSIGIEAETNLFTWWQNLVLNVTTEKIISGVSYPSSDFYTNDLANITVEINNLDNVALNSTEIKGLLIVDVFDGETKVKTFATDDDFYVGVGETGYYSYTNDFSGLSAGNYTILAKIIYGYPSKNITLKNQTHHPVNASTNITISEQAAGPSSGGGGGSGGGGISLYTKYSTVVVPSNLSPGDTARLYINISNERAKELETTVKIFVLKNYKIINEIEKNLTVEPRGKIKETVDLFTASCRSEVGEYKVKVEFYESGSKKRTEDVQFNVLPCKSVSAEIKTGKLVYYPDEKAQVRVKINNSGNVKVNGNLEILIKNNTLEVVLANISSILIEPDEIYDTELEIDLLGSAGIYNLNLIYRDRKETLAKAQTSILISEGVATTVNVIVWLILLAVIVLIILSMMELYKGTKEVVKAYKYQNQNNHMSS